MKIRDITLIGILSAILFLVDQVLSFVPFLQLTMLLIILFSKKLGLIKTSLIIIAFITLDYLIVGFDILFFTFTLIGWLIVSVLSTTLFKKSNKIWMIAVQSILFSFLYSWIYIIPSCLVIETSVIDYLKADILFELSLAASSFISVILLYKPLDKIIDRFI